MGIVIFLAYVIAVLVLAYFVTPIWLWAAVFLALGTIAMLTTGASGWLAWTFALALPVILGLMSIPFLRRLVLTGPALGAVRSILPKVSRTEQEALDAGTVGWDAEIFSGRPDWQKLMQIGDGKLTAEEQAFLDGPTEELCKLIDDWDIRNNLLDLPPEVWDFMKSNKFFGMLISKEYGGLGFSAQAQSQIVSKVGSRSGSAGITVMVPNSLGPGELLEKYGTDAQKDKYLARLADGREIPCFALTGPHSGSDAAGMRDVGVVTYGKHNGERMLGVLLNFDKRYITLSPVATLAGLAFYLHDPDNHLGKGEDVGITLALIPSEHPGMEIGKRHFPVRQAFLNGPVRGKDVFIPLDYLIGGADYAGQGWRMLMECLSTGRAISLPAVGSVTVRQALRGTSAYARIRRQFGIPVGMMEGVAEPLAAMVKNAYRIEAGRQLTATMVDEGQKPSVVSALLKYRATEAMRDALDGAFDIHGGKAIQEGPHNYLFSGYMLTPVAITVEGANILTRTLITFAQGVLRAHPYLYAEISAAQNTDKKAGLVAFDKAFCGHVGFMLANITGSFFQAITGGAFNKAPVTSKLTWAYKKFERYAQSFALLADWTAVVLGGSLKSKQALSGRMADILSDLYLWSAVLKRFEDDGRLDEDLPVAEAVVRDAIASIETEMAEVLDNFPNPFFKYALWALIFPLGHHARPETDARNYELAKAILGPSSHRDRMTRGIFVSQDPNDPLGLLEDALQKVTRVAEIEKKFIRALKKGEIDRRHDRDAITDAVTKEILTHEEAGFLRLADEATDRVVQVDEFEPDALARHMPVPVAGHKPEAAE
ncbi:MAG: acyl-CoA dehydrogenase [Hyphomicrobiaceae bacterium]|nr:acyl-CoA dehydrogenase [Hyphomicrobiaceae bacterium]MCC0024104.1 acyl-CoA dehydrogenase [Hyphomicrobiaceae bacterium]